MSSRPRSCGWSGISRVTAGVKRRRRMAVVEENRGDVRGAQKIFKIVVRHDQLGNLLLILGVKRRQLFIDRFEFFVAALEFFIPGEQLLVRGLKFLLCGLLVLVRRLQLFFCVLQVILQIGDAPNGFAGGIESRLLGAAGAACGF